MRLLALAFCALSAPTLAPAVSPGCTGPLPSAPHGLPQRVLVETQCGTYAIDGDGSVVRAPQVPYEPPPWMLDLRGGHIVLIENRKVVWRSRNRYGVDAFSNLQSVAVGTRSLAFSLGDRRLRVARFGRAERIVGRREVALGWSGADRLLTADARGKIWMRTGAGRRKRFVAKRVVGFAFESGSRTLVFATADATVFRTDGRSTRLLSDLSQFGLNRASLWPNLLANGLIAFETSKRLVVLNADGSPFAAATLAAGTTFSSYPTGGAGGVAFSTVGGSGATQETIYALHAGQQSATALYTVPVYVDGCRGAGVEWYGDWILFWNTEGRVVALESERRHAPIDLTETVAELPGVDRDPGSGALIGVDRTFWA
jgi:hypothetical protein